MISILINPFDTGTLYAGTTTAGVFKTVDGADHWSPANTGLGDLRVTGMALDPVDPGIVYAGTDGSSIFVSYDGAQTWY